MEVSPASCVLFLRKESKVLITEVLYAILFLCVISYEAPAILSTLYLEGAISKFYPEYTRTGDGLEKVRCRCVIWLIE